jgi:transposase
MTMQPRMARTAVQVATVASDAKCSSSNAPTALKTWLAVTGYHSNATMRMAAEDGLNTYVSEPDRARRCLDGQAADRTGTYANRRRIQSKRGRTLMRRRGELIERRFAYSVDSGGMRRVPLPGRINILKRYIEHVAAVNLHLVMRQIHAVGTPRGLQGRLAASAAPCCGIVEHLIG